MIINTCQKTNVHCSKCPIQSLLIYTSFLQRLLWNFHSTEFWNCRFGRDETLANTLSQENLPIDSSDQSPASSALLALHYLIVLICLMYPITLWLCSKKKGKCKSPCAGQLNISGVCSTVRECFSLVAHCFLAVIIIPVQQL